MKLAIPAGQRCLFPILGNNQVFAVKVVLVMTINRSRRAVVQKVTGNPGVLAKLPWVLLVEINQNLPDHMQLVAEMNALGYGYDPAQVARVERRQGPFKGCAEYVFKRR